MMNIAKTVKTLCVLGVSSLGLNAGVSQADYDGHGGGYYNPYMPAPQAERHMEFRQQLDQFDVRMDRQLQRILNGMEQGKLTMGEATSLLREHQEINALERQYMRDGRLGPRELADLDRRLDLASQHILRENQDRERAGFNDRHDGRYR
jgi:hypothetical protein